MLTWLTSYISLVWLNKKDLQLSQNGFQVSVVVEVNKVIISFRMQSIGLAKQTSFSFQLCFGSL